MHGGRRPGSGAPKGNTNAMRSGNYSRRTLEVFLALRSLIARNDEPVLRALIQAAFDAGLFRSSREIGVRHVPAAVRLWHPMLFTDPGRRRLLALVRASATGAARRPPRPRRVRAQRGAGRLDCVTGQSIKNDQVSESARRHASRSTDSDTASSEKTKINQVPGPQLIAIYDLRRPSISPFTLRSTHALDRPMLNFQRPSPPQSKEPDKT